MGGSVSLVVRFLAAGTFWSFSAGLSFVFLFVALDFIGSECIFLDALIFLAGILDGASKLAFDRDLFAGFIFAAFTITSFPSREGFFFPFTCNRRLHSRGYSTFDLFFDR